MNVFLRPKRQPRALGEIHGLANFLSEGDNRGHRSPIAAEKEP
jgi:hypothetical protein